MNFKNLLILALTLFVFSACEEGGEKENDKSENDNTEQQSETQNSSGDELEIPEGIEQPELTEVNDEELEMFASALGEIQMVNQMAQQQMIGAVENAGLEVERFSEIQQAQESPDQDAGATEEEMGQFQAAIGELDKIQSEAEQNMIQKIKDQGLTEARYEEIGMTLQSSPEMQERFQEMMEEKMQQQAPPAAQ